NPGYYSTGTDVSPECSPNSYTVQYAGGDGATGAVEEHTCVYGQDCLAKENAFEKAGYVFSYWECTGGGINCDGDSVLVGGNAKNATTEQGGVVTLTAVWVDAGICRPGQYYNGTDFEPCPAGSYCSGEGNYTQGVAGSCPIETCPSDYPESQAGASSATQCYKSCTDVCEKAGCEDIPNSSSCAYNVVNYDGVMYNDDSGVCVDGLRASEKNKCRITRLACKSNYYANPSINDTCTACPSEFSRSRATANFNGITACYQRCTRYCDAPIMPLEEAGELEYDPTGYTNNGGLYYPGGGECTSSPMTCDTISLTCYDGYHQNTADVITTSAEVCVPNVYSVTLDANGGELDTDTIYLKYATGWFSDEGATSEILTAPIPTKENVTFGGYADENGVIQINAAGVLTNLRMFSDDSLTTTLTAQWVEARTDCRAGKYFDATTQSHTACPVGSYCPGEGLVAISETGCVETCPDGFTSDLGLATKETDCYKVCSAGQYWDGSNCVDAESGFYGFKEETRVNYGTGAYGNTACPTGAMGSDNGRNEQGDCFVACPEIEMPENAVAVVAKNAKEYFDGSVYPTCVYTVTCDENGGWTVVDGTQNTTNPQCEYTAECPEGFWCVDGKKNECPDDGDGNPNTVPTSPRASSKITDCYVIYSPYAGFQNGLASAKCNYNDVDTPNGYTTCNKDTVFNCNGGYYYNGGMLCEGVKPGYYSPAPVNPTQTVVDAASVVQTACPSGVYKSEELAASFTQCQAKCETSVVNSVTVTPVTEFVNGASADSYEACLFNVSCKDGYSVNGNGTTNPTCVANEYTISFDANGGTGNIDAIKCVFDSGKCTLPANTFERTGYSPDVK
ncbi:MAG: InlB B-repeat-containing protein, partial [Alphaproteobacteria bacterium]|nr:InlB B-repeat-containing protein [Alphaproteobacteria bacterium]